MGEIYVEGYEFAFGYTPEMVEIKRQAEAVDRDIHHLEAQEPRPHLDLNINQACKNRLECEFREAVLSHIRDTPELRANYEARDEIVGTKTIEDAVYWRVFVPMAIA